VILTLVNNLSDIGNPVPWPYPGTGSALFDCMVGMDLRRWLAGLTCLGFLLVVHGVVAAKAHGHGVLKSQLRKTPLPHPSGDVWVWAENLGEEVRVNIYKPDGSFDQRALAALDHGFRCKRTHEERAVDPKLYELLSVIQDHFGGKRITLISGFRFQKNEGSRHFHASAMDIRVDGVSVRELWQFAQTLDRGGMGIGRYPRSRFVHVDFRAPGEPSYRWIDNSGHRNHKRKSRARRPNS